MSYDVKILADSTASGVRLTTVQATFPRFILAEVNTHRMLSRNSASSRAIPVEKNIERVLADPFVPEAFGSNKKGMQAGDALIEAANEAARNDWLRGLQHAIELAEALVARGVHKQWANRPLEPYAWHTAILSATEWDNFFLQRCHPAASPEFRAIAERIRDAMLASKPIELVPGAWHLPLVSPEDYEEMTRMAVEWLPLVKLSVARCARVSYLTHEGKRDVATDLALYERLVTSEPKHLSPLEHAARVATDEDVLKFGEAGSSPGDFFSKPRFVGNFAWPWIQHRKDIAGEDGRLSRG